jgi:hypothetical protein
VIPAICIAQLIYGTYSTNSASAITTNTYVEAGDNKVLISETCLQDHSVQVRAVPGKPS